MDTNTETETVMDTGSGVFRILKRGAHIRWPHQGPNQVFQFAYYVKKKFGQRGAMADLAKG